MATNSKRKIVNLVLPPGANTDLQIIQDAKVPVVKWVRVASMNETKKLLTSSYVALIHYAGTLEGKNATVESFLERLGNGMGLYDTDPIFHLRKFLLSQRGPKAGMRRAGQQHVLALVIKAWNATKKDQKMLALRYASAESFPQL